MPPSGWGNPSVSIIFFHDTRPAASHLVVHWANLYQYVLFLARKVLDDLGDYRWLRGITYHRTFCQLVFAELTSWLSELLIDIVFCVIWITCVPSSSQFTRNFAILLCERYTWKGSYVVRCSGDFSSALRSLRAYMPKIRCVAGTSTYDTSFLVYCWSGIIR